MKGIPQIVGPRPSWAKALIVAELEQDECDIMADYFNTTTSTVVALAWSRHGRDLFSEMRKAAALYPETEHMGPGCGIYTVRVVMVDSVESNGRYYHAGQGSHWHNDMLADDPKDYYPNGRKFSTRLEAMAFVGMHEQPEAITFGDQRVRFRWDISEESIEHREKYSMGHGYYLKGAGRYSDGWRVVKHKSYRDDLGGLPASIEPLVSDWPKAVAS